MNFEQAVQEYKNNPVLFAEKVLKVKPQEWQKEVLESAGKGNWISVRASRGVGKTAVCSWTIIWFLFTHPFSNVIVSSPTMRQLKKVMLKEISKWSRQSELVDELFSIYKEEIRVGESQGYGDEWFCSLVSSSSKKNFSGFHSSDILSVIDEASGEGLDEAIEEVEGSLTGHNQGKQMLFLIGNPNRRTGYFARTHLDPSYKEKFDTFHINHEDSPLVSQDQVDEWIERYGEDSDWARVNVFGEFPKENNDNIIPFSWCQEAINTELQPNKNETSIGIDCGGAGANETVAYERQGPVVTDSMIYEGTNESEATGKLVEFIENTLSKENISQVRVYIDEGGLGGPIASRIDEVIEEKEIDGAELIRCNFGGSVTDDELKDRYLNFGVELWMNIRDRLQEGLIELPDDDKLISQLSSRPYKLTSAGRMKLLSKERCAKNGLPSPDRADAIALCFSPKEPNTKPQVKPFKPGNISGSSYWKSV